MRYPGAVNVKYCVMRWTSSSARVPTCSATANCSDHNVQDSAGPGWPKQDYCSAQRPELRLSLAVALSCCTCVQGRLAAAAALVLSQSRPLTAGGRTEVSRKASRSSICTVDQSSQRATSHAAMPGRRGVPPGSNRFTAGALMGCISAERKGGVPPAARGQLAETPLQGRLRASLGARPRLCAVLLTGHGRVSP